MNETDARLRWLERTHTRASLYWSNREVWLARQSEANLQRKADGKCRRCPRKQFGDLTVCLVCRDKDRASALKRMRRLRAAEKRKIRTYRPVDDVIDLTRVRILRAARRLDWFTFGELFDLLGGGDERLRNTTTKMLERLTTAKLFERRRAARGFSAGYGVKWEYLITPAGIAELEKVLRPVRAPGMRAA